MEEAGTQEDALPGSGASMTTDAMLAAYLNDPYNANTCRIGSNDLFEALTKVTGPSWELNGTSALTELGSSVLCRLLSQPVEKRLRGLYACHSAMVRLVELTGGCHPRSPPRDEPE